MDRGRSQTLLSRAPSSGNDNARSGAGGRAKDPNEGKDDRGYSNVYQANPAHLEGVADMSQLIFLEEDNVVHNLTVRYGKQEIYTYVSSILIAVNPYEELGLYGSDLMTEYRGQRRARLMSLPPHCYAIAEESYQLLDKTGVNQSMVICGESGSGKTETAKILMRYLAQRNMLDEIVEDNRVPAVSKDSRDSSMEDMKGPPRGRVARSGSILGLEVFKQLKPSAQSKKISIEEQFLQANPVLEAFGNAQTILNNNSSRFGKFTKVLLERDTNGKGLHIVGSFIETYLLEKSRVVNQAKDERNYHIFYQVFMGMSSDLRKEWGLGDMTDFHYLNQSDTYVIRGVSDEEKFLELREALLSLEISPEMQQHVFRVVAAILHLGNVKFDRTEDNTDGVLIAVTAEESVRLAARLAGVTEDALKKRLLTRSIKVGVQQIVKPLNMDEAEYNRDGISKTLYHGLFQWIVYQINATLYRSANQNNVHWIGILDVFGFEYSDWNNSFEQLCINFANERLQQYFNQSVIQNEQDEYLREAIPWAPLTIPDSQDIISLIAGRPNGIVAILDSACVMPKATDDTFFHNLFQALPNHPRMQRCINRKIQTNRAHSRLAPKDPKAIKQPSRGLAALTGGSGGGGGGATREKFSGFTINHYAGDVTYNIEGFLDKNADAVHPDTQVVFSASTNPVAQASVQPPPNVEEKDKKGGRPRAQQSVGSSFVSQLDSLMQTLQATTPHFVRCVNPNQFKEPQTFDSDYVRPQLRCGGLIEALRVLKLGYPSRISYANIFERYGHVLPPALRRDGANSSQSRDFAEALFLAFGLDKKEYQLGLTKVFFRPGKQDFLEGVLANPEVPEEMVAKVRSLMNRKRALRLRAGVLLCVRVSMMVAKKRQLKRITRAARVVNVIAWAFSDALRLIHRQRAAVTLQASFSALVQRATVMQSSQRVRQIQRFTRDQTRGSLLAAELRKRVAATAQRRAESASAIQGYWRTCLRGARLRSELDRRVASTRAHKARLQQMELAKKEEEERAHAARLAAERERAAAAEAARQKDEAARREHEEKQQKLAAEVAAQRAANEAARLKEEREAQERKIKEEHDKAEENARIRAEIERAREAQHAKEEGERMRRRSIARRLSLTSGQLSPRSAAALATAQHASTKSGDWSAQVAQQTQQRQEEERAAREAAARKEAEIEEELRLKKQKEAEAKRREVQAAIFQAAQAAQADSEPYNKDGMYDTLREPQAGDLVKKPPPPPEPIPDHIREQNLQRKSVMYMARLQERYTKMTPEEKEAEASAMRMVLLEGDKFLKYGKYGKPHIKYVAMNVLGALHWSDEAMDPRRLQPSESSIHLRSVTKVYAGKHTNVMKRAVAARAPDHLCLSIVSDERSLDLQCVTGEQRDLWIRALQSAIRDVRSGIVNMITGERGDMPLPAKVAAVVPDGKTRAHALTTVSEGKHEPSTTHLPPPPPSQIAPVAPAASAPTAAAPNPTNMAAVAPAPLSTSVRSRAVSTHDLALYRFLELGGKLLKHGRMGNPRERWFNCIQDILFYGDDPTPSSDVKASFVQLEDVINVVAGKRTKNFQRKVAAKVADNLCFSIILNNRTLDLQASSASRRDNWVHALNIAVQKAKESHDQWMDNVRNRTASVAAKQSYRTLSSLSQLSVEEGDEDPPGGKRSGSFHEGDGNDGTGTATGTGTGGRKGKNGKRRPSMVEITNMMAAEQERKKHEDQGESHEPSEHSGHASPNQQQQQQDEEQDHDSDLEDQAERTGQPVHRTTSNSSQPGLFRGISASNVEDKNGASRAPNMSVSRSASHNSERASTNGRPASVTVSFSSDVDDVRNKLERTRTGTLYDSVSDTYECPECGSIFQSNGRRDLHRRTVHFIK